MLQSGARFGLVKKNPTTHGKDLSSYLVNAATTTVCLSQAWYDVERRRLVVFTDSGIPKETGRP
jgi:hypothetical protein